MIKKINIYKSWIKNKIAKKNKENNEKLSKIAILDPLT
jgi:hypothetical protein